jgi:hypothetical protein
MIRELAKLANELDKKALVKEADLLDLFITKLAYYEGYKDRGDFASQVYFDPTTVKVVSPIMLYSHRLFLVASFKYPTGKIMLVPFYSSQGSSELSTEQMEGSWVSFRGKIGEDDRGYIEKFPGGKWQHPKSMIGRVAKILGEKYPPAWVMDKKAEIKREQRGWRNETGGRLSSWQRHEINAKEANKVFKSLGVYNISEEDLSPSGMDLRGGTHSHELDTPEDSHLEDNKE